MSAWAKPAAKCVCVDAGGDINGDQLVEGQVYTVVKLAGFRDVVGNEGVLVAEAKSGHWLGAYRLTRFRPLVTRTQEQDVALFRDLLVGLPAGVDA